MAGIDDIDCSTFFDHIDDLLDIPDEACTNSNNSISSKLESGFFFGDFKDFPSIWTHSDAFPEPTKSLFSENHSSLSDDLTVPYEDIAELDWLSNFLDDSSAGYSLTIDVPMSPSPTQFQTTSPVSVLESSSSSYAGGKFMPVNQSVASAMPTVGRRGRARSERRPRLPTFNHQSSKIRKSDQNTEHKKKKRIISIPAEFDQNDDDLNHSTTLSGEVRKCQHCEIAKTPQWRAGPNGPKTLCNACGVRYKSGRLFPEYRPAASPTFVPSIHSNSHKKVLEMRVKDSHTE